MRVVLMGLGLWGMRRCLSFLSPLSAVVVVDLAGAGLAQPTQPLLTAPTTTPAAVSAPVALPLSPNPTTLQPLRVAAGAELWSIPAAALQQFATTGTFSDQRLLRLVANSGWPDEALRAALLKPYAVDLVAVARFLDSPAGQTFLQQQTRAYSPLRGAHGQPDLRVPALRAAILAEAQGGTLTALGLVRRLPAPLVLNLAGPAPQRCSSLPCDNPQQCSSVLSWLVFLPACLQAAAVQS